MNKKMGRKGPFDDGALPPFFSENFRREPGTWRRIRNVDFELIGRILSCHLVIEHYLEKFIEYNTPEHFSWNNAKLSFSQKLTIAAGSGSPLHMNNLQEGIKVLNRIRNGFSHNLEAKIDHKHIEILLKVIKAFSKKKEEDKAPNSDLEVVEAFTMMVCAFIAGYCTSINNKDTKKNREKRVAK